MRLTRPASTGGRIRCMGREQDTLSGLPAAAVIYHNPPQSFPRVAYLSATSEVTNRGAHS